jgi:hypothetical protein
MTGYREHIKTVADTDVKEVTRKDIEYGASWLRRGGVGAFMMLARKWDRLETALAPHTDDPTRANGSTEAHRVAPWDIVTAAIVDGREEGIIDDIRDLRRYLLLVESEIIRQHREGITITLDLNGSLTSTVRPPSQPNLQNVKIVQPLSATAPRRATHAEFEAVRNVIIPSGSMKGLHWSRIYKEQMEEDGWRCMLDGYTEEYGR